MIYELHLPPFLYMDFQEFDICMAVEGGIQEALTFLQLSVPNFNDERRVFAMMDDPQGKSLDALLRVAEL